MRYICRKETEEHGLVLKSNDIEIQSNELKNDKDEPLAMIPKGTKRCFKSFYNPKESGKGHSQGVMNETPKVIFPQKMTLIKIPIIVVDFQVT